MIESKHKIKVYDYYGARNGSSPDNYDKNNPPKTEEYNVEAYCVGGSHGILAFFLTKDLFYIAAGDDGHWWLIYCCDVNWFNDIKNTFKDMLINK